MLDNKTLSKPFQRLKKIAAIRRLTGSRLGRHATDIMSGRHGVRRVMQSTISTQRAQDESTADVVLVSSNGAGLGHLTRLEAINRHLSCKTIIYTLSKGYRKLGKNADELVYFPSSATLDLNSRVWNPLLFSHFSAFISTTNPKVIVFDGTFLYSAVVDVARSLRVPLVWIRRGRWKKDVRKSSVQYKTPEKYCDMVIVPGEYAYAEPTTNAGIVEHVAPVVVHEKSEVLNRREALEHFGLPDPNKYVLVQLGAGNINDIDEWVETACEEVLRLGKEWVPVLLNNPLNGDRHLPDGAVIIEAFPIGTYLKAFEFIVVAAGYNSVQEAVASEIPIIAVPNLHTVTDDQLARALSIDSAGLGVSVTKLNELQAAIQRLASPEVRLAIKNAQSAELKANGAQQIAEIIQTKFKI